MKRTCNPVLLYTSIIFTILNFWCTKFNPRLLYIVILLGIFNTIFHEIASFFDVLQQAANLTMGIEQFLSAIYINMNQQSHDNIHSRYENSELYVLKSTTINSLAIGWILQWNKIVYIEQACLHIVFHLNNSCVICLYMTLRSVRNKYI